jgi:hypothetical protein
MDDVTIIHTTMSFSCYEYPGSRRYDCYNCTLDGICKCRLIPDTRTDATFFWSVIGTILLSIMLCAVCAWAKERLERTKQVQLPVPEANAV